MPTYAVGMYRTVEQPGWLLVEAASSEAALVIAESAIEEAVDWGDSDYRDFGPTFEVREVPGE